MSRILGKADLLSPNNLRHELVQVPQLDAALYMRELSAAHVVSFKKYIDELKENGVAETTLDEDVKIMAMIISFSACDENGVLLFDNPQEAQGLAQNNINVLMDLGNKAMQLSGIQMTSKGLSSEVTDNLPNDPRTSLSENSLSNSDEPAPKS